MRYQEIAPRKVLENSAISGNCKGNFLKIVRYKGIAKVTSGK